MAGKYSDKNRYRKVALPVGVIFLATFFLAACSSSSDDSTPADDAPAVDPDGDDRPGLAIEGLNGTPADQLTSPWLAHMSFFRLDSITPGTGDAYVELLTYDDDFSVSTHLDFYTPELDTCEIYDLNDSGGGDDFSTDWVSGGQSLSLETASGSWFELEASTDGIAGTYATDNGLPAAFPDDLTLSIPGDIFPSVAAYPLVEPLPPVRLLPTADILTADDIASPFTWVPNEGVQGGYFQIIGLAFDSNEDFIGFPVACLLVDDGSFTMPQEVVDAFETADAADTIYRARFERVLNRVDFIDGVVFHQKSTVSE